MAILSLSNLSVSFGALDLFSALSASLEQGGKVGLVGPNGVGKTTLLRVIAGQEAATSGAVHLARGVRLGYLRQEAARAFRGLEHSVWAEMLTVFEGLKAQEARLRTLEAAMAGGDQSEEVLAEYGAAQERLEQLGGYDYEVRIRQTLQGLGFAEAQWQLPLTQLSGGQLTRALLARLLLERPDLLILDEPTNHLDVAAVEWLEGTLRGWPGALLVVSHDRYFLDRVVDRIWELSRAGLESYRGNYSAYAQQRQERWDFQEKLFASEKERLERELEFIRRNIAGQNTDIAMGRLSRLGRELQAIEQLGLAAVQGKSWSAIAAQLRSKPRELTVGEAAQLLGSLRPPQLRPPHLNLRLRSTLRSGDLVLRTKDLEIGYPGTPLFHAGDLLLERGDVAALIGPNGAGKTTFLRTVLGKLEPLAGEVRLGAALKVGYFAQAHEALVPANTVIQELSRHRLMTEGEARELLAQYLFRGDDVWKPVAALSGGERGRLALAILGLQGANFLLLDEPTNHLDIAAQEALQESLEAFGGTVLLVSHDRYLVDRLASQIWALDGEGLRLFPGSYQEWQATLAAERQQGREATQASKAAAAPPPPAERTTLSKGERRRLEATLRELEGEIHRLEERSARHSATLQRASEAGNFEQIQRAGDGYQEAQARLEALLEQWATLSEQLG